MHIEWILGELTPAHLLCDHHHKGSQGRSAYARDGEQLDESSQISSLPDSDLFAFRYSNASDVAVTKHDLLKSHL